MTRGGLASRRLLNLVIYAPFVAGLLLLLGGRIVPGLRGNFWLGIALLLLAFSCLVYAARPGDGDLSDEQVVKLQRIGIRYTPAIGQAANAVVGFALLAGAIWLLAA